MVHVQDVLLVMHVQKEKRKTIVNHPKNQINYNFKFLNSRKTLYIISMRDTVSKNVSDSQ